MAGFQDSLPYVLVGLVLVSVAVSVIYIGMSAGNSDTRNELQKHIGILTATNVVTVFFLGFLMYYYLTSNSDMILPFTVFMTSFNLFLGIMAVSVSVLQQLSV
jgi:ACR3 family arsenite efflux pump ArsB